MLLNKVLHGFVLDLKFVLLTQYKIQFPPQVGDVVFTERLQIFLHCWNILVLQQLPFSTQHLVLLFQPLDLKFTKIAHVISKPPWLLEVNQCISGKVKNTYKGYFLVLIELIQ